jgi:glycerol kinase
MPEKTHILSIDQGTTSTRAILFDWDGHPLATARRELAQHYPADGWVEHDPEDIWRDTLATIEEAVAASSVSFEQVAAIGITNQRETAVVWDRATGRPIHKAIVWQDRRTAGECQRLKEGGVEPMVSAKTGLLLDPYFSATKIAWILDHVPGARPRAERGELAFGTIDSFLLWRLTSGAVHATDATNASRTMLFNIHTQVWDAELLKLFRVPAALLPEVCDCAREFGQTTRDLFGVAIPITGIAGDQQAALIGQACFKPGMIKATYGTGCFALMNTGRQPVASTNRLLTTIACRLGGQTDYALEGSIFIAGAAMKWLRDGLGIIADASQSNDMATRVSGSHGVYMVPAFVGLGAPHWNPNARGLICGLTLDVTPAHIARAAIEAVAYQTLDLAVAMENDGAVRLNAIRIDGGMSANDWLCQFLADMLQAPVERPAVLETTALGAAFLAGLGVGLYESVGKIAEIWARAALFEPRMAAAEQTVLVEGWRHAVRRALLT